MSPDPPWMIYGANGYTGRLIAREAVAQGLRPILAGRNRVEVQALAEELNCRARVFDLDEPERMRTHLADCGAVLNCAGPFSATAEALVDAALAVGAHYLDITGEIEVIEALHARHAAAVAAGVALLPAVGFDVVPSDCLAAQLAARVKQPRELLLAMASFGRLSPGTAKTMIESLPHGGRARIAGRIERVPVAWRLREIPFPDAPRLAVTIPWGDVSTAYYSTGVENIETYLVLPKSTLRWLRRLRPLAPLAGAPFVQQQIKNWIERRIVGPSAQQRAAGHVQLWARVTGSEGDAAEATLTTPDGYALTALTSVAAVQHLINSPPQPGFQTPSQAFGVDFILRFPQVQLQFASPTPATSPAILP